MRYAAKLDEVERAVVAGLMEQVVELLDAPAPSSPTLTSESDPFEAIVAGMGGLGQGVSVRAEDQRSWPDLGPVPEDARSFGERDPALQRLLPYGNRQDDEAAAEFRRLTEAGLRRRKTDNLLTSITALRGRGSVELDPAAAQAFLVALTDVRLVLGERLGLRDDADVERLEAVVPSLEPDDPVVYASAVYDFLTWLQESLATAMLKGIAGA
ncbi:MAG: DUF2017 domain-containing protein [Dermatophilaceae bacterium]